jgi:hypothetical protein
MHLIDWPFLVELVVIVSIRAILCFDYRQHLSDPKNHVRFHRTAQPRPEPVTGDVTRSNCCGVLQQPLGQEIPFAEHHQSAEHARGQRVFEALRLRQTGLELSAEQCMKHST